MADAAHSQREATKKIFETLSPVFAARSTYLNMDPMSPPQGQIPDLVARVAAGDRAAIVELLERYRGRLRRMVALRLDPRLQGRVDASDVIQEGYLDAMRRLDEFIRDPSVPFYIWLRFLVGPEGAGAAPAASRAPGRDVVREVSIYRGACPARALGPWPPNCWAS